MSVVAVWYVGLCIVVFLWGGVICWAEKGLCYGFLMCDVVGLLCFGCCVAFV